MKKQFKTTYTKRLEFVIIQHNSLEKLIEAECKKELLENQGYNLIDSNGVVLTYKREGE